MPATVAAFKQRYPEFATVADGLVQVVIDETESEMTGDWIVADRPMAVLALVAHRLCAQGATGAPGGLSPTDPGPVAMQKIGDVATTFASAGASPGGEQGGTMGGNAMSTTAYGRRFLELRRRSFGGPIVA